MLRLPIIRDRFRDAVIVPWQAQPSPPPSPAPSHWPLIGMFGLGMGVGIALGGGLLSFAPARQQLQRMSGRFATIAGGLVTPIRDRAKLTRDQFVEPEGPPVVAPGPQ